MLFCLDRVSSKDEFLLLFFFGALTLFGDGYVFPEIVGCGERHDALCDDEFLYAGCESGVEYAGSPGDRGL